MYSETRSSSELLKMINQQKVLRLIYTEGPISRVELAEKTGLTQQTITNIVNRLLKDDIILETVPVVGGGGRRPIPLVVNSPNMYAIGIRVTVRHVQGSLMDFRNEVLTQVTEDVPVYESKNDPLRYIYKVVEELLKQVPSKQRLKGIGCSVQGLINSKEGIVIYSAGLHWRQFPLKDKLEQKYGIPVHLDSGTSLLALVENLKGALADSRQNITLKFDDGVGGAIVLNKQLHRGANFVAGGFAHYKAFTGRDAYPCHCGAKGCLTTLATMSGLKHNSGFTSDELAAGVRANEPEATRLFTKIEGAISRAVSNIIILFNPEHVLITGKLMDQWEDLLLPSLKQHIMDTVPEFYRGVKLIKLPQTPNESKSAGGLVMNHFFDVPFNQLYL